MTRIAAHSPTHGGVPRVCTLLACDLADSTALLERLGDAAAAELIRRHDRLARELIHTHLGREIDKTDGFLALFARPVHAIAFALAYQRALRTLGETEKQPLRARIGVHVGAVVIWENTIAEVAEGAKPYEVEGLTKSVVARLMTLAMPGQLLLSNAAYELAHRDEAELKMPPGRLRWLAYGHYRFKGVIEPIVVYEVGEVGVAPLRAPPSGAKAMRVLPLWRQRRAIAAVLLTALVAAGTWFTLSRQPPPEIAFGERDWVVVTQLRNLTSQSRFDHALDAALRVGLEQSRYVNVLPSQQVRDALKRMNHAGESITRELGVELATREGARAVLVPTLTEVGTSLRFSVEVIDPTNGRTVRVESNEASDADGVLAAMDRTLATLRGSLGESLKDIEQASAPLARITTTNLEALRAYSQIDDAQSEGKYQEAMALLELALRLDPEFAMAHARLGSLQLAFQGQLDAGHASIARAIALSRRLSLRERLMIEGAQAHYRSAPDTHQKWSLAVRLYPDIPAARHNLGLVEAFWRHDPAQAVPHFRYVADSLHPRRGESLVALAMAHLQLGQVQLAQAAIDEAHRLGGRAPRTQEVLVALALGRRDAAQQVLDSAQDRLLGAYQARELLQAALAIENGELDQAAAILHNARQTHSLDSHTSARLQLAELALKAHRHQLRETELQAFAQTEMARLGDVSQLTDYSAEHHLAYAALLAQRQGYVRLATQILDTIEPTVRGSGRLAPSVIVATTRCLQQRELLERSACLDLVTPRLYATEVAAWDTAKAGEAKKAQERLAAVTAARPRAYVELELMDFLIGNQLDAARAQEAHGAMSATVPSSPELRPDSARLLRSEDPLRSVRRFRRSVPDSGPSLLARLQP